MKLIAFIAPTPYFSIPYGTHNGYVAIPPEHPCSRVGYDNDPVCDLDVHGGITFSGPVCAEEKSFMSKRAYKPEWIGKRTPLLDDVEYITEEKDIPDNYWILGFDTCHYCDNSLNWNRERVIEETLNLKRQLEEMITDYGRN